jgi:hypothetical protein
MTIHFEGDDYDISHLAPAWHVIDIPESNGKEATQVPFEVRYSNHVYSEGCEMGKHTFLDNNKPRIFSPERWNDSLRLNEFMSGLSFRQVCSFEKYGNLMMFDCIDEEGNKFYYHIYFKLTPHPEKKGGVSMFVESAYRKESWGQTEGAQRKKNQTIKLGVAMVKRSRNETLRKPPK